MHCNSAKLARSLTMVAVLTCADRLAAEPPIDRLLPDETKAYISTPDLERLLAGFSQSQLGQFWHSPALKPFAEHLRQHPDTLWARWERDAGTTLAELRDVASGESALAIVESEVRDATVFLFRVRGNEEPARQLLIRVEETLRKLGAKFSAREFRGATLSVFELPAGTSASGSSISTRTGYWVLSTMRHWLTSC